MDIATIEALLKPRIKEDTVPIPGVGNIRVRGLSRDEAITLGEVAGTDRWEILLLAIGIVEPAMTEEQVTEWRKAGITGEFTPVIDKVMVLSGLKSDSAKELYKSDGDDES